MTCYNVLKVEWDLQPAYKCQLPAAWSPGGSVKWTVESVRIYISVELELCFSCSHVAPAFPLCQFTPGEPDRESVVKKRSHTLPLSVSTEQRSLDRSRRTAAAARGRTPEETRRGERAEKKELRGVKVEHVRPERTTRFRAPVHLGWLCVDV